VEDSGRRVRVVFNGVTIADTRRARRVLETSHPPVYYIPPEDVRREFLQAVPQGSFCEWKGQASYFTVRAGDRVAAQAAWSYPDPTAAFAGIRDYLAFYPGKMDACLVDEEVAQAQPGDFYGGWVTREIVGPFKGAPGTSGW
jgi:uncharacterized protein (DUF427 family)